ncbi:hypothetical protein [Noviherbaspirillum aerium]|uniref:hypothetical protein n=1 Tax=Noviherbaspirillum aerium TaxID=2588497 RepID=UPI00124D5B39|nr:hypothetical protein [Noviherbaspirillum aerium]
MAFISLSLLRKTLFLASLAWLQACTPTYNWRETRGPDASYAVLMPAKPSSHSRPVDLDGLKVTMTMTAAEVDGVTFAVGTAEVPEAAQAGPALVAMKTAMVRNLGGTIKQERQLAAPAAPGTSEIEVTGQGRLMLARFAFRDRRVYQAVVVGKEKEVSREAADTFLTSFKPG